MDKNNVLLEVKDLCKHFPVGQSILSRKREYVKAVEKVSFNVLEGEIVGLVGESGCGKTTVARTIIRLYEPTSGEVNFRGENIFSLPEKEMQRMRRKMQMIFQDPYSSLNPRMTVGDIIAEPLLIHKLYSKGECGQRVKELLKMVGLNPEHSNRFPHEFSGGQRQRIGIARALAVEPQFLICDEPISALDVSIQAQVVNKLQELKERCRLTYLFIAHDLSMVRHISDRIIVMYLGKVVETASSEELYHSPRHPYTQALLSAIPIPDPNIERRRQRIILEGDIPSPLTPPSGCRFHTRCRYVKDICMQEEPKLLEVGNNHLTACHFWNQI